MKSINTEFIELKCFIVQIKFCWKAVTINYALCLTEENLKPFKSEILRKRWTSFGTGNLRWCNKLLNLLCIQNFKFDFNVLYYIMQPTLQLYWTNGCCGSVVNNNKDEKVKMHAHSDCLLFCYWAEPNNWKIM